VSPGKPVDRRQVRYPYQSLEDFLIANPLHADGQLNDGWNSMYPVKGREIEATVLFADISDFSARTLDLTPAETLVFVNNFFAWITAEALRDGHGIVDKYIGDEIMVVFSEEFGASDPFLEAVQAARWIAENDSLSFAPHMGLASGRIIVGYVGTPLKYSTSVFGAPVNLAARCAGVSPEVNEDRFISSTIVFPAAEWGDRDFKEVMPPVLVPLPKEMRLKGEGEFLEQEHAWRMLEPRTKDLKNLPATEIREIVNESMHLPSQSAEDRARAGLEELRRHGFYRPRWKSDRDSAT
jgi:class 3 adenylate cyclase